MCWFSLCLAPENSFRHSGKGMCQLCPFKLLPAPSIGTLLLPDVIGTSFDRPAWLHGWKVCACQAMVLSFIPLQFAGRDPQINTQPSSL